MQLLLQPTSDNASKAQCMRAAALIVSANISSGNTFPPRPPHPLHNPSPPQAQRVALITHLELVMKSVLYEICGCLPAAPRTRTHCKKLFKVQPSPLPCNRDACDPHPPLPAG